MSPSHRKKLTRGQKWRFTIISLEIVVLLLVFFVSSFQEHSTTLSAEQINENMIQGYTLVVPLTPDNAIGHRVAFYVDYRYRVRILDNGVVRDFAQFGDCPTRLQKIEPEADTTIDSYYHATYLTLATIHHGISFYADSYEVFVGEAYVTLITNHGGEYRISSRCD